MTRRKLGKTDLEVSILGFGASPLGNVFGEADPGEGMRAVNLAIDEGVNFFDVSPYYGLTLAETRLGAALEGRRQSICLSTKCGRYGSQDFDFSPQRIRQGLEESLIRLRTDYVDLLLAHDVEFGSPEQIIEETIPAMRRLREEGKTRYVGISGYPPGFLVRIAQAVPVDAILNYCHYNLLVNDIDRQLAPFAAERGIGLINASPLHMGILTEQGGPEWHPAPLAVRSAVRKARELCQARGANLSDIALRFCLDYPNAATTLVGMSTTQEVSRNLRALEGGPPPEMMQEVEAVLAPVHNTVWISGRAENNLPSQLP
ncbi:MAG TPA: aldo/keto reductase [Bryobacteraceae bacterium]|nr:aldo/keto reductase [Bryobacteraceae bacterium]